MDKFKRDPVKGRDLGYAVLVERKRGAKND